MNCSRRSFILFRASLSSLSMHIRMVVLSTTEIMIISSLLLNRYHDFFYSLFTDVSSLFKLDSIRIALLTSLCALSRCSHILYGMESILLQQALMLCDIWCILHLSHCSFCMLNYIGYTIPSLCGSIHCWDIHAFWCLSNTTRSSISFSTIIPVRIMRIPKIISLAGKWIIIQIIAWTSTVTDNTFSVSKIIFRHWTITKPITIIWLWYTYLLSCLYILDDVHDVDVFILSMIQVSGYWINKPFLQ